MQGRKKQRARKSEIPPRDTLTEQQRKEIEEAFDILDTDGSGLCMWSPLYLESHVASKSIPCHLKMRPPNVDFKASSSGRIDAGDLLVALRALGFEPRKDEVKKLMSDNDKENNGSISKAQFVEIFKAKWVRV